MSSHLLPSQDLRGPSPTLKVLLNSSGARVSVALMKICITALGTQKMTDDKQSNAEGEGNSEYGKSISNHSQHWKRESDLDEDLYDAITCTKTSRQHQVTRMSNKVTWLLREQQLEEVIKTKRSFFHPSSLVRIFEDYQSAQSVFEIQVRIIGPPSVGCSFIHLSFLDRIFGDSQSAQSVFAIQVRIIGPPSAGVTKSVLFTNKTMEEYKIKLPETIAKVNKSITTLLHAPVVLGIGQCVPANNQPSSQAFLREMNKPPSLQSVQESIGAQAASTILRELSNCSLWRSSTKPAHRASCCQQQPSGLMKVLNNLTIHSTMTTKEDSMPVLGNPLRT
jgi:hypothetical protein